jgi:hypothetical protein
VDSVRQTLEWSVHHESAWMRSTKKPLPGRFIQVIGGEEDLERVRGIEPLYEAWEAAVLPLNYTRKSDHILADGDLKMSVLNASVKHQREKAQVGKRLGLFGLLPR